MELCKQYDIKTVICAGDWFHRQDWEYYRLIIEARNIIQILLDAGIEIKSVIGTHDKESYPLLEFMGIKFYNHFENSDFEVIHGVPFDIKYFGDKELVEFDNNKHYFFGHWHQPSSDYCNKAPINFHFLGSIVAVEYGQLNELCSHRVCVYDFDYATILDIPLVTPSKWTITFPYFITNRLFEYFNNFIRIVCNNEEEVKQAKMYESDKITIIPIFKQPDIINKIESKIPSIEDIIIKWGEEKNLDTDLALNVWNKKEDN